VAVRRIQHCRRRPGDDADAPGRQPRSRARQARRLRRRAVAPPERPRVGRARARALRAVLTKQGAGMEMAYRERWEAEIAEMRRVLAGLAMKEECKWGKPTYTLDGKNIVIISGFKEYFTLGFFQGALMKDPKRVLVQLGQVQAGRVMKFTSAK